MSITLHKFVHHLYGCHGNIIIMLPWQVEVLMYCIVKKFVGFYMQSAVVNIVVMGLVLGQSLMVVLTKCYPRTSRSIFPL